MTSRANIYSALRQLLLYAHFLKRHMKSSLTLRCSSIAFTSMPQYAAAVVLMVASSASAFAPAGMLRTVSFYTADGGHCPLHHVYHLDCSDELALAAYGAIKPLTGAWK